MIAKIVSDEYLRLKPLGYKNMIGFEDLIIEKFKFKHSAIFCMPISKRFQLVTPIT